MAVVDFFVLDWVAVVLAGFLQLAAGGLLLSPLLLSEGLLAALAHAGVLFMAEDLGADGGKEGVKVVVEIIFADAQVPVKEVEQLLLHEIHFGAGESKRFKAADVGVLSPVLVLGRGVVEVLGGEDESGEEDAVDGASQTLGHGREALLESLEVDQGCH